MLKEKVVFDFVPNKNLISITSNLFSEIRVSFVIAICFVKLVMEYSIINVHHAMKLITDILWKIKENVWTL